MKSIMRISITALSLFFAATAFAQTNPPQKVQLQEAMVFLRGAQLTSTVTFDVPAGDSEWVLSNVAGNINEQSLSVAANNGVVVQSSSISNDYLDDEVLSPRAADIKRQLDAAKARREQLDVEAAVITEQIEMIKANRRMGGKDGTASAAEVERMFNLLNKKMSAALLAQNRLAEQQKKAREQQDKLQQQLNEEKAKGFQPGGRIALKLYAPQATRSTFTVSYVAPDAGWVPSYDLQVSKVGEPVQLVYKARVFQNSGINWDKAHLILSSGNPTAGAQTPMLSPWFVSLMREEPLYQMEVARPIAAAAPSPVMRSKAAGDSRQQSLDGYVTTNANGIDTQFDIALPYSIPSDGKGHLVRIKTAQLPATYRYVATPKLDADAFLQARVTGWGELNLLPGQSNIFYEGNYVGQGRIDVASAKDTLDISLGRDKRILVKRESDPAFKKQPEFFSSSVKQQFGTIITARNTRKDAVDLVVIDQAPISRDSDVKVEDLRYGNGVFDAATGEVQWTMTLAPNEVKTLPLSFTVKYPKDREVLGL
jgi:uncharacterized protein (TIGR02231 family)